MVHLMIVTARSEEALARTITDSYSRAVEKDLLRVVIGRIGNDHEVSGRTDRRVVCSGSQVQLPAACLRLLELILSIFVTDR